MIVTVSAILKAQSILVILVPRAHSELSISALPHSPLGDKANYAQFNFPQVVCIHWLARMY